MQLLHTIIFVHSWMQIDTVNLGIVQIKEWLGQVWMN